MGIRVGTLTQQVMAMAHPISGALLQLASS